MNPWDFNHCRSFLEKLITENPENQPLIDAYNKLIEKKTEYDIAVSEHNAENQRNWENNQREMTQSWHSSQADVAKESIKKTGALPGYNTSV